MGKEAPHVGFPEAVISKYAQKLVAIGYKVGVVEQMETPAELKARNDLKPKGVKKESAVRRELCQVLTKGTAANADVDATYLLAVTEDVEAGSIGVCYVDAQVTPATPPHPRPGMPATTKRSAFSPHASATSTRRRRRSRSASASTTSTTRACAPSSRSSGRPKS